MTERRDFIEKIVAAAGLFCIQPAMGLDFTSPDQVSSKIHLNKNDVILFQGDSITDAGRNREHISANDPQGLGNGYAFLASAKLLNKHADKKLQFLNRGISGNKVPQLTDRWSADCINLKPNILSILIGINDYWHKRSGSYSGNSSSYKHDYKRLIENTLNADNKIKIIICEPFAVNHVKHVTDDWFPEITEYQLAAKELAREYNTLFVPFQKVFDQAVKIADGSYWTTDGVHTTLAGAELMAEAWLTSIK